jgi:DNA-directed RNA polymerase specialized sigma subunit
MARKRNYLNGPDLLAEIILSKELDELTPKAVKMLLLLTEKAVTKLHYRNKMDKDDCIQSAMMDILKYWRGFKPEKSTNAFAYYTTIIYKGAAKGWNKLHPETKKQIEKISLNTSYGDGDGGIYSI